MPKLTMFSAPEEGKGNAHVLIWPIKAMVVTHRVQGHQNTTVLTTTTTTTQNQQLPDNDLQKQDFYPISTVTEMVLVSVLVELQPFSVSGRHDDWW